MLHARAGNPDALSGLSLALDGQSTTIILALPERDPYERTTMDSLCLYISHESALHYWRTNPLGFARDYNKQNIRSLQNCAFTAEQVKDFHLSEAEFGPTPFHVLIPPDSPRPRTILHYHTQITKLPHHSLYPIRDGIHVVSPLLCFVQLCKERSLFEAFELGMELCGTYAKRPETPDSKAARDFRLMNATKLAHVLQSWPGIQGLEKARRVAPFLANNSASPMESKLYLLLCLPQKYGGYNITKPLLNNEIELTSEHKLILHKNSVRPDMLWKDSHLVVEYDGGYHNEPMRRVEDEKRRVALEAMGFTVFVVKKQQIYDPLAFDSVAHAIAQKTGKRIRPLTLKQSLAREALRDSLLYADLAKEDYPADDAR